MRSTCLVAGLAALFVLAAALSLHARVRDVKIHGYVTRVVSPTEFEVEDYRVTRDASFSLDIENGDPDLRFRLEDIRVGVEVEIKGLLDDETGELKARSIKVDLEQFKKQKQTAILSRPPAGVTRSGNGWTGTFLVDGQRIRVTPSTEIGFKGNDRELEGATDESLRPLRAVSEVTTGMAMTYEGARSIQDAAVVATRVEFARNFLEPGEKKMWDSLQVSSRPFEAAALRPGELKIEKVGKFKTLPDQDVQDYVARVGRSLIPAYQRAMDDRDSNRIPFRFYVVQERTPNAFALPNGIVVVHSSIFDIVENEAQFADIIGHEIAHSVQEHTWRQQNFQKGKRTALALGSMVAAVAGKYAVRDLFDLAGAAIVNGYSRNLENQADRLGLEYMVDAGYDPREAPRVWKLMSAKLGDQPTNFFWSNHDNHATRRSYLMNELRNNYAGVDYSRLRTGDPRFQTIVRKIHAAGGGMKPTKAAKASK
jgi:Zn-dependent protease with chaperone function